MQELPFCKITIHMGDEKSVSDAANKSIDMYLSILPSDVQLSDKRLIKNFLYFWVTTMFENQQKQTNAFLHSQWEEYALSFSVPKFRIKAILALMDK
jgi:hypothetical protein